MYSETPNYNLKVVISETGLKPDTIRAWERRYGLPVPDRTAGGHRLYSERDIATFNWLIARKEEGLGVSKAVKLWRQIEEEGRDPLTEMPLAGAAPVGAKPVLTPGKSLDEAREAWIQACLAYQEADADQILAEAFAAFPVETVVFSVLQRGLSAIGTLWYSGEASVQQEHFASALATRRLEALIAATPQPSRAETILVSCATHEDHTFSPLTIVLLLRRRGYKVVYLGANVPLERLEATVDMVDPTMVVLTAQHIHGAAMLQQMGFFLERSDLRMAYGGLIFNRVPELQARIPGEYLGEHLHEAVQRLETLLGARPQVPRVPDREPALLAALDHFRDRQSNIESEIWNSLKDSRIPYSELETANHFLAQGISAALTLGDPAFMGDNMEWIQGLLTNYGRNHGFLELYLDSYRRAAHSQLGASATPVLTWLDQAAASAATEPENQPEA
jgi:methanogenic corrinoid protein MtbC1